MTSATIGSARGRVETSSAKWAAAVPGALFAVALVAGVLLENPPNDTDSDATWRTWFADHGHRVTMLVAGYLFVIAGMSLIVFFARLHARIADTEPATRNPLALLAGTAAGVLVSLSGLATATIPGATIFGSQPVPTNADLLRFSIDIGFPLAFVGGMIAMAVAIVAIALEAQRSGYFGRAMTIASYLAAVAGVAAVVFFPAILVVAWVVAVSVLLARRPARE